MDTDYKWHLLSAFDIMLLIIFWGRDLGCLHFMDEETEAQEG